MKSKYKVRLPMFDAEPDALTHAFDALGMAGDAITLPDVEKPASAAMARGKPRRKAR